MCMSNVYSGVSELLRFCRRDRPKKRYIVFACFCIDHHKSIMLVDTGVAGESVYHLPGQVICDIV